MKMAITSKGCSGRSRFRREPADQLRHQARRIEGRCRLEHDADLPRLLVEGHDAVGGGLVVAAMPGVLLAVDQQVAVQLPDVILGERMSCHEREHQLHDLGVAGDLLLVAVAKDLI